MFLPAQLPELFTPLPIYALLLVGVIAWRTRSLLWLAVLAWAYVMSVPAAANLAAAWLEAQYQPIRDLAPYRGHPVVLLSSGSTRLDHEQGWVNRLTESGWERLQVAVATARRIDGPLYIAGGPLGVAGGEPIAVTMKNAIDSMGVGLDQIVLETQSSNTYENLALLRDDLGRRAFILVTSASHLPRAMAVAEQLGLDAVPQPADYLASDIIGVRSFIPSSSAILHWHIILHELAGSLFYALKGFA